MKKSIIKSCLLFVCYVFSSFNFASEIGEYDELAPDKDYVWVDGYNDAEGNTVKGFYRERTQENLRWIDAHYDGDIWLAAHWQPVKQKINYLWAAGHVGGDNYWVRGHWREKKRVGFFWKSAQLNAGIWRHGFWQPVTSRTGYIWVRGHPSRVNGWRAGHWRLVDRSNYRWVKGLWRYGRWAAGYWVPVKVRNKHLWVPGYWTGNTWQSGFWRTSLRAGFHWRAGYWGARGWIVGGWNKGPRIIAKRRFPRLRYPHKLHVARVKHHRHIKHPAKFAVGKSQKKFGKKQNRLGRKIENRGANSGNQHLENRGKHLQKKGKKNKKKGQKKIKKSKR